MKVKAFFTRKSPFYLLSKGEATDSEAFDAYPVEVEDYVLDNVRSVRKLIDQMEEMFRNGPAPEECAVEEAAAFEAEVKRIFKTRAS